MLGSAWAWVAAMLASASSSLRTGRAWLSSRKVPSCLWLRWRVPAGLFALAGLVLLGALLLVYGVDLLLGLLSRAGLSAGAFAVWLRGASSVFSDRMTGLGGALVLSRLVGSARRTGALPADGVLMGFLLSLIVVKVWLTRFE